MIQVKFIEKVTQILNLFSLAHPEWGQWCGEGFGAAEVEHQRVDVQLGGPKAAEPYRQRTILAEMAGVRAGPDVPRRHRISDVSP